MMPAISLNALPAVPPFQFLPEADLNFGAVLANVAPPAPQPIAVPEVSEPSATLLNFLGINPVKGQLPISDSPPVKDEVSDSANDESSVTPPVTEPLLTLSPFSPQINEASQIPPPVGTPALRLALAETQSKPSLAISTGQKADASTAGRPEAVPSDFGVPVSSQLPEDATKTPLAPLLNPFGLVPGGSLSKPSIALATKGGSTSTSSVQTAFGTTLSPEVPNTPPPQPFGLAPGGSLSKPSLSSNFEEKGSTSTSSVQTESGGAAFLIIQSGLLETKDSTPTQPTITAPSTDPLRFIVDRQLDLARDSRWLDALARDIVAVADAPDRLSFRLSPPQLGQLDVDLSSSDSGLSVRMNASTEAAAHIVAAAQPRLIDELKSQGVRVAEAHVSTGGGGSQGQGQPQQQRDADQMIEFVRQRIERNNDTNLTRPTGRFA
jgi:flagellar hook-length control protein FliK